MAGCPPSYATDCKVQLCVYYFRSENSCEPIRPGRSDFQTRIGQGILEYFHDTSKFIVGRICGKIFSVFAPINPEKLASENRYHRVGPDRFMNQVV